MTARDPSVVEFFFDFSSPWTYMAFHQLQPLCEAANASIVWKPFYLAAVFRRVNPGISQFRANVVNAKVSYVYADMQRWASNLGITIGRLPVYGGGSQPLNSAKSLRGAFFAHRSGRLPAYAEAVFEAYWRDLHDISDLAVLADIVIQLGLDPGAYTAFLAAPQGQELLQANTNALIRRGGFGSPTFFVDDEMYFGNDRLGFVRERLLA